MDTYIMTVVALLGLVTVSEAYQCYECERYEVFDVAGGDAEEHCEEVTAKTPKSGNSYCKACVMDTYDKPGFDYLRRYCWTSNEPCRTGPHEENLSDIEILEDVTDYTIERTCCTSESCNYQYWNADSASSLQLAGSLLAAVLFSFYHNLRN